MPAVILIGDGPSQPFKIYTKLFQEGDKIHPILRFSASKIVIYGVFRGGYCIFVRSGANEDSRRIELNFSNPKRIDQINQIGRLMIIIRKLKFLRLNLFRIPLQTLTDLETLSLT